MKEQLIINGIPIQAGERTTIMLPTPKLYDWTPLFMPVHVIRGKEPGPTLCVTAAMHGDEVNGVEVVRRLLKKKIFKNFSGTLIAVPILNVYGFLYQDRYLMDRRDLNRSFPGSSKGSLAARLAKLISTELLSQATHMVDLHSGSLHRTNLPQIRATLDSPKIRAFAKSFNAPVVLDSPLIAGSMRKYAHDRSIPFLVYEAGESLRFDELSIRSGVNGIIAIMHKLNMIKTEYKAIKTITPVVAHASYWVRASYSGVLHPIKSLGKKVKEGDTLAIISNPTSAEEHKLKSPVSGIIIGLSKLPLVHEGAALFNIACFRKLKLAEEQVESMNELYT